MQAHEACSAARYGMSIYKCVDKDVLYIGLLYGLEVYNRVS